MNSTFSIAILNETCFFCSPEFNLFWLGNIIVSDVKLIVNDVSEWFLVNVGLSQGCKKGIVFYGQEPPCGESTTTECGVNFQLRTSSNLLK